MVMSSAIDFDCVLVLDVECTCQSAKYLRRHAFKSEIIQIAMVLIDVTKVALSLEDLSLAEKGKNNTNSASLAQHSSSKTPTTCTTTVVDEFNTYVKPTGCPILSQYCTNLTGIRQEDIDDAPILQDAITQISKFIERNRLNFPSSTTGVKLDSVDQRHCVIITDGACDFLDYLWPECARKALEVPGYFRSFIDVRNIFDIIAEKNGYSCRSYDILKKIKSPTRIAAMMEVMGVRFRGRHHNAMIDARNLGLLIDSMVSEIDVLHANLLNEWE